MWEEPNAKSDEACTALLLKIYAGHDAFLNTIAPEGWANSPYVHFFHPTLQQQLANHIRLLNNFEHLVNDVSETCGAVELRSASDFKMDDLDNINSLDELIQVLGLAVWDIFSNNHAVIAADGGIYDLGSFRGTGDTISHFINKHYPLAQRKLDYMDFYMGTCWISSRADISPFYRRIFAILKDENCNWLHSFPEREWISLTNIGSAADNAALCHRDVLLPNGREAHNRVHSTPGNNLDEALARASEHTCNGPLRLLQAYQDVFGCFPGAHPCMALE